MNDFVRFDDRALQPRKLDGMLEYLGGHQAIDGRKVTSGYDYSIREVVSYVMRLWRTHHPRTNNSGVYAFVNTPECIDPYIIPSPTINGMHREFEATIKRSWNENFVDVVKNTPSKFKFAQMINIDQVRVVWAHPTLSTGLSSTLFGNVMR